MQYINYVKEYKLMRLIILKNYALNQMIYMKINI